MCAMVLMNSILGKQLSASHKWNAVCTEYAMVGDNDPVPIFYQSGFVVSVAMAFLCATGSQ